MIRRFLFVLALAGSACVPAFNFEEEIFFCASDADCPSDLKCIERYCGLDECADGTHDCGEHSTCTNARIGFECACEPGFEGDFMKALAGDLPPEP